MPGSRKVMSFPLMSCLFQMYKAISGSQNARAPNKNNILALIGILVSFARSLATRLIWTCQLDLGITANANNRNEQETAYSNNRPTVPIKRTRQWGRVFAFEYPSVRSRH